MARYAALSAGRDELRARLEGEIAVVRDRYATTLDRQESELSTLSAQLKKFAQGRKTEFKPAPSGDGRSYEHAGVALGFRQSPGRVEIRKEDEAIDWLRDYRSGEFVRIVHQADREKLLAALREGADSRLVETLAAHGIRFEQKDKFFVEVANEK